jgi:CrtC N-terminal lipocalin domain
MVSTSSGPGPVFIDLPADHALHVDPAMAEIWYVTCVLQGAGHRFGLQTIITTSPSGRLFTSRSLVELGTLRGWHSIDRCDPEESIVSSERLDIDTPGVSLRGDTDQMRFRVVIEGNLAELTLHRQGPVLYNCGTGLFPYFTGPTYQYDIPGMTVAGTITIDGAPHQVEGGAWWDHQWSASRQAFGTTRGFTWFGICLDNGVNLSVWDTSAPDGSGQTWATAVRPDGAHSVVSVEATRHSGWTLDLRSLDARFEISHELVHEEPRFYSGILTISGTYDGVPVNGFGVVDTVPHET